ncbi:DUF3617 domain-containing protein [Trichloromonas sp.]|uniref:DUF3617 domain-containing protein n=1 Tax=Trichloromonas sp. TaxID=3069249 RepID=UPI002A37837B|nr:DUF3617 family protein [Trichloromonas sp.]
MWKKLLFFVFLCALGMSSARAAGSIDMQEGQWEITTRMEMPGMPVQIPPMTFSQCITQQDLVPQNEQPDNECTVISNRIDGNTVVWSVVCKGEGGETRGDGQITYHGDHFEGSMQMAMPEGMTMTNYMSGKRIGPCR